MSALARAFPFSSRLAVAWRAGLARWLAAYWLHEFATDRAGPTLQASAGHP